MTAVDVDRTKPSDRRATRAVVNVARFASLWALLLVASAALFVDGDTPAWGPADDFFPNVAFAYIIAWLVVGPALAVLLLCLEAFPVLGRRSRAALVCVGLLIVPSIFFALGGAFFLLGVPLVYAAVVVVPGQDVSWRQAGFESAVAIAILGAFTVIALLFG